MKNREGQTQGSGIRNGKEGVDSVILTRELAGVRMIVWRLKERKELERPPRGQACSAEWRVADLTEMVQVCREESGLAYWTHACGGYIWRYPGCSWKRLRSRVQN